MENYEINNENYELNNEENKEEKSKSVLPVVAIGAATLFGATVLWKKVVRPRIVKAVAGIMEEAQTLNDVKFEEARQNADSTGETK